MLSLLRARKSGCRQPTTARPGATNFIPIGNEKKLNDGPPFGNCAIAIFNACLAITLQFARIVWAAGRDRAWPEVISAWIGKVDGRRGAPWVATLIVGVLATILSFQGTLVAVVTFTAVLLIVLYALICISALVSRYTQKDLPRPWKRPA